MRFCRTTFAVLIAFCFGMIAHNNSAIAKQSDNEAAAQASYDQIESESQDRMAEFKSLVKAAESKDEQIRLLVEKNPSAEIAAKFMQMAKKFPNTNAARDAVLFAYGQTKGEMKNEAMNYLLDNFIDKISVPQIVASLKGEVPSQDIEGWFLKMIENAQSDEDKAAAMFGYAKYVSQIPVFKQLLEYNPGYDERLPKQQVKYIFTDRTDEQRTRLANILKTVIADYGDLKYERNKTYGAVATSELFDVERLQVGMVAPEIEGNDLDDISFRLSDYQGKVVMLDFWGHWCFPCRQMYDHERFMTQRLADKPFVLLGVNSDRKLDTARKAVRDDSLSWRHFWNGPQGTDGEISKTWNVEAWPTVYLIDQKGVIRYKGVLGEQIDRGIEELLAEMGHDVSLHEDSPKKKIQPTGAGN